MHFGRLQAFLAVVDEGTVTAAAATLHIAQPALSRQLRVLEKELNLSLFEAKGNRLMLTAAGSAFANLGRDLLAQARRVEAAVGNLSTGRVESLVVAATTASITGFLAPFIATMNTEDPVLLTHEAPHFRIHEVLRAGVDFMVSPAPPQAALTRHKLGTVALKAHVRQSHEWAMQGRESISLRELSRERLILPTTASVSRVELDLAMGREGLALGEHHECDYGHTIQALAAAGQGIGLATDIARYGTYALEVVEDGGRVIGVPLHVAWDPRHYAATTITALARRLSGFLEQQGAIAIPPERQ
ncbi:LysR family transcriptional regulator [Arthrobacter sp. MI7-26]|uniref:LysR family transcriptional regulator n=1 Tax=Arthrobacter sp. MI7-26 TaxID=2993653 RepID=UPI002248F510|nr:LysR family transcriptional regulator [Arthrobacter sp. MI7-26]MCX2746861.1 LysR family transcriptional regulator [Arthrobacter sp. MI7-26]